MDGKTDNYRAERRGPEELAQEIEKAAKARDVKSMAGDFGDYRLPKNFGRFGGVYVANIPPDQCQFLLDTMSPGPMVAEALKWRIKAKATEGHTP